MDQCCHKGHGRLVWSVESASMVFWRWRSQWVGVSVGQGVAGVEASDCTSSSSRQWHGLPAGQPGKWHHKMIGVIISDMSCFQYVFICSHSNPINYDLQNLSTIWLFNIAMENPVNKWRFLARKLIIYFYGPCSMAMLNYQRVKYQL